MKNIEIYEHFESNKRLLLYLIKEKIILVDDTIVFQICSKFEKNGVRYSDYFHPEIKQFIKNEEDDADIFNNLSISEFEEKRLEGENDS